MARDVFRMTVSQPVLEPDLGLTVLRPLAGIRVSAFRRGTTTTVTVFQRATGATEGPTPESGATGGPNPFVTGPTGDVEFWAEGPIELDVFIEDTQGPARIATRTFGWNAMPAGVGSIPTSAIAADASLGIGVMGPSVVRQLHQIGEVIDWWRPADTVPIPAGFEICDGRSIPAGQHSFPGIAGAINVPDLRNMFILGADPTKVIGTGITGGGNTAADGPGVAGTGGSNAPKNFAHSHGVPVSNHQHHVAIPNHWHPAGALSTGGHSHWTGNANRDAGTRDWGGSGEGVAFTAHAHGTNEVGNIGVYGNTDWAAQDISVWAGVNNVSLNTATNSTTWNADPGNAAQTVDMKPRFYGLIKLMKVRYA